VRLWNIATGDLYAVLKRHQDWVMHTIFSPDGRIAAAIDYRRRLYGWDIDDQHIVLDQAESTAVAITASDDLAAVAHTGSNNIHLINPQTGQGQARLAGHSARINQLAFSGDHSLLASASDDTSVRLWGVPQPGQAVIVTEPGAVPSPEAEMPEPFTLRLVRLECLHGQELDGDEVYIKVADRTVWDVQTFKRHMSHHLIANRTTAAFDFRAVTFQTADGWQVAENYRPEAFIFADRLGPVKVQLWEADSFLRGGDDLLGEVIVTPDSVKWDEVECEFRQGRAHYRLTYAVFGDVED
jgi:WD40 repeat protein